MQQPVPQMREEDRTKIARFCQENVQQQLWYWNSRYLEDPEGTMQSIATLSRYRAPCVDYSIRVVGAIVACLLVCVLLSLAYRAALAGKPGF